MVYFLRSKPLVRISLLNISHFQNFINVSRVQDLRRSKCFFGGLWNFEMSGQELALCFAHVPKRKLKFCAVGTHSILNRTIRGLAHILSPAAAASEVISCVECCCCCCCYGSFGHGAWVGGAKKEKVNSCQKVKGSMTKLIGTGAENGQRWGPTDRQPARPNISPLSAPQKQSTDVSYLHKTSSMVGFIKWQNVRSGDWLTQWRWTLKLTRI